MRRLQNVLKADQHPSSHTHLQPLWFVGVLPAAEQQHCGQEWSPSVSQDDPQLPHTTEELKLRPWKDEQDQEPPLDTDNIDITAAFCGSTDNDSSSTAQPCQLNHTLDFDTKELDFQITDQIKTEPHGEGYEQPDTLSNAEPESLAPINAHCSRTQNEHSESAQETEQHSNKRQREEHVMPVHSNSHNHYSVCRKSFPSPQYLKMHMRSHKKLMASHCGVCGKSFSSYGKLKEHQRLHTGERPFCCDFCGKRFNQNCNLKVHLRVHSGEKPYSCPVCGKGFTQSSQVKMHLRTHR
ncbi:oocyte zinc finger protein XlCOF6.1-like [Centroberyx affinis]|uniref:oocyte zinc finger protein XlCOF6.1-like n=1 Tax=Centroberyx affinis TaxID=166261 RepID=UPI003A5B9313